jgi:hypothetical protein
VTRMQTCLTMLGLGFLTKIVMAISQYSSINKYLGGIGQGCLCLRGIKQMWKINCTFPEQDNTGYTWHF